MTLASGEMSEWLKEHDWKSCVGETSPWVRIPLSPFFQMTPSGAAAPVPVNSKHAAGEPGMIGIFFPFTHDTGRWMSP